MGVDMSPEREVLLINDGGKTRIVTVATALQCQLLPLHLLFYDRLARNKWLLRGDATANSFSEFDRVRGEVFVSGDYESATDNFVNPHSSFILEEIFKNSSNIPLGIKTQALKSLTGFLSYKGTRTKQTAGQLMGNLLSFPLLCLTNFLAFKAVVKREVPLRINGDDIVFRATRKECEAWFEGVGQSGLVLSKGKTLVHERFFSLNSTFFEGRLGKKPSLVPVIRAKCIYAPLEAGDGAALASRLHQAGRGFSGKIRGIIKGHLLRFHRKAVAEVGCSLNRALGARVPPPALAMANLVDQEQGYLSAHPMDDIPRRSVWTGKLKATDGWKRVRSTKWSRGYRGQWQERCREVAWTPGVWVGENKRQPARMRFDPTPIRKPVWKMMGWSHRALLRHKRAVARRDPAIRRWMYEQERKKGEPEKDWIPEEDYPLRPVPCFRSRACH
jgi:hypothetical protein